MTAFWKKLRSQGSQPPEDVGCGGVMAQLFEYIDAELDEETVEKIRAHLEKCSRCYPRYNFEHAFLRFLGEHAHVEAPPELRKRVFASLLEESQD
jgi:anti-sigma factor (TIGR02949 family)